MTEVSLLILITHMHAPLSLIRTVKQFDSNQQISKKVRCDSFRKNADNADFS